MIVIILPLYLSGYYNKLKKIAIFKAKTAIEVKYTY